MQNITTGAVALVTAFFPADLGGDVWVILNLATEHGR